MINQQQLEEKLNLLIKDYEVKKEDKDFRVELEKTYGMLYSMVMNENLTCAMMPQYTNFIMFKFYADEYFNIKR